MNPLRVHAQLLQQHHLFEPLSAAQMSQLLEHARIVNLDKGQPVFRQGELAESFFFVIDGCIKIFRITPDGQEKVFEACNRGQTFAEAMTFMDTPHYVANAQAVEPTQLLQLSNQHYLQLISQNPDLAKALLARLSMRLHQRLNELETLSLKNATHRVVRYFLAQIRATQDAQPAFDLAVSKQLVAGHLAIQPETFSRVIHRMQDDGIIELDGRHIRVLHRQALEDYE
ncbi:Crp/Fnr family transcriptional regulator [Atopomonas sediminilitoris]|uniref:Crp/Fnr family transcriptional regulator n=1 Tax=Atopomonas sediminilitoris TaxID=2919919 RepID=UPI001F4D9F9B|nr:Crp/Fnr family transcriptional regulator [Atopomonas sediminilitoris]MCJ8170829.1 Crp/Fnr family transcriptional regulator [Atopomonas sediminilitoris]